MHQVILVDPTLPDIDTLLDRMPPATRVVEVAPTADAHAILAAVLAERPDTVHLVAHGAPGLVRLGSVPLTAGSLADRSWPDAAGTEILIHACEAGAGDAGRRLVDRLAAATGACVAAASGIVGHASLGGRWTLDVTTGAVAAGSPFAGAEAWVHHLAYRGTPTAGNDTLIGDNSGNTINGLAGDDSIVGGTGADSLVGGAGNDTLVGGGNPGSWAPDTLNGGLGADHYVGGNGFTVVTYEDATSGLTLDLMNPANSTGEAAGDTFENIDRWVGSNYSDRLIAGNGPVWFWGHDGDDLEYGSAYNDTLEAGNGNDTIHAGAGNDLIFGRADNDQIFAEAGNDTAGGGAGNDLVDGGDGDDVLFGDWGTDTLIGGAGNDRFYAGETQAGSYSETQSDVIQGGDGNDTYFIANQIEAGSVSFDGGGGTDTLSINSDSVTSPEGKVTTGTPAIDLTRMTLTSVEVLALSGSKHHTVTMTAAQANGFASITGASIGDSFAIAGASLSGSVTSGNGSQLAAGQVQAEVVNGTTLIRIGTDATPGADVTLRIAGSFDASSIHVSGNSVTLGQGQTGGTTTPGQTLTGTSARDYLAGGAGADTIIGNAGNDYMIGGAGSDTFVLKPGDGWDYVADFQAGATGDVLDLRGWSSMSSLSAVLSVAHEDADGVSLDFGPTDGVRLAGVSMASLTSANFVFGNGSAPSGTTGGSGTTTPVQPSGLTLSGTAGNDYLEGRAGNDTLIGGAGNDYLIGGAGSDTFVEAPGAGWDCIGDFQAGSGGDVLDLQGFTTLTSFDTVRGRMLQSGTDTLIDFDGSSTMRLVGVDMTKLTASNFLLFGGR